MQEFITAADVVMSAYWVIYVFGSGIYRAIREPAGWLRFLRTWTFRTRWIAFALYVGFGVARHIVTDDPIDGWTYAWASVTAIWVYYFDKHDDDWWKKQRQAAAGTVKSLGHKLIVAHE